MKYMRIEKFAIKGADVVALPTGETVVGVLTQHEATPGLWYVTLLIEGTESV